MTIKTVTETTKTLKNVCGTNCMHFYVFVKRLWHIHVIVFSNSLSNVDDIRVNKNKIHYCAIESLDRETLILLMTKKGFYILYQNSV